MLETLIGVGILVAVILFAKTVLARNGGGSTTHPPIIGGGGTVDGGSTGPGDGSVTPPKSGPDAV